MNQSALLASETHRSFPVWLAFKFPDNLTRDLTGVSRQRRQILCSLQGLAESYSGASGMPSAGRNLREEELISRHALRFHFVHILLITFQDRYRPPSSAACKYEPRGKAGRLLLY
jgi:hypothetical protein